MCFRLKPSSRLSPLVREKISDVTSLSVLSTEHFYDCDLFWRGKRKENRIVGRLRVKIVSLPRMEAVGQGKKLFSFKQLYLAPDNYNEKRWLETVALSDLQYVQK